MLTKRIIPCLDVKDGRVVKGVNFVNLADAGDPVEVASAYSDLGADELVFLDITASVEKRKTLCQVIKALSKEIFIPLTVGGGINCIEDIRQVLLAGADKIAINTSAVINPELIDTGAKVYGSQCIVVAIDAKKVEDEFYVYTHGGREKTSLTVETWAREVEQRGAGEILLTSMDRDGTKKGFDLELLRIVTEAVNIPVIASGGAGTIEHFYEVFEKVNVDAGLAASIFHFKEVDIGELKEYLSDQNVPIREVVHEGI